ncbi:gamma-glutamylcyclotransferase family protein [Nocardiopsis rhodophaea]|uniref:gamma-glutamylcyclotransferase family protein n=1 Tax=Nocardiopsis rhodophaea TaxID=280238 RepID=UPI0031DFF4A1
MVLPPPRGGGASIDVARGPKAGDALFSYGTLMFPEIRIALLGRTVRCRPAAVCGWRAAALKGRPYPGLVAAADATTEGVVILGLSGLDWKTIDRFEGPEYLCRLLDLAGGGTAWAYLWLDPSVVCGHSPRRVDTF